MLGNLKYDKEKGEYEMSQEEFESSIIDCSIYANTIGEAKRKVLNKMSSNQIITFRLKDDMLDLWKWGNNKTIVIVKDMVKNIKSIHVHCKKPYGGAIWVFGKVSVYSKVQ